MDTMTTDNTTTSPDSNASAVLLGDFLKQQRLDKNYSLEKLSQKTKISINILKSLEANDFDHLPSAAYIKGFVRSYVKILGISQDEAIHKMEYTYLNILGKPFPALNHTKSMSPIKANSETSHEPTPHEVIENSNSIKVNTKSVLPIVILATVILLFIGGYKLVSSIVENEVPGKTDLGPKIESSAALVKQPEVVAVTPTEEPVTTKPVSDEAVEPEKAPKAVVKPAVPELKRNFPSTEFKKIKGRLFQVKTDAQENSDTTLLPENVKKSMIQGSQNVYIRATEGNTWLSYKIDNTPIKSAIISKGSDLYLQGDEIRLFLGNVNVTKIFYNNYLISTPTKSGVKSLIFPEESSAKYMMPLFPKAEDDILYTAEDYIKRMNLEEEELKKRQKQ
jgi:cytoskeleton protein RodZ